MSAHDVVISQPSLDSVFKALASSPRRQILAILSEADSRSDKTCCGPREICACKISQNLGLSASTVSHHMAALGRAGLVTARKDGTWTYYTLNRSSLAAAAHVLSEL